MSASQLEAFATRYAAAWSRSESKGRNDEAEYGRQVQADGGGG
jgi:hypothetical protein